MFWKGLTKQFPRAVAALTLALLVGVVIVPISRHIEVINSLEDWTADWRTALFSPTTAKPSVSVVLIDEETLQHFSAETRSPTDRALIADLIEAICAMGPETLALDFFFDAKTSKDDRLLDAIKKASSCRIVLGAAASPTRQTAKQAASQADFLKKADRPYGYLNIATDFDGVVRMQGEADESAGVRLSFAEATASAPGRNVTHERRRISWLRAKAGAEPFPAIPAHFLLSEQNESANARKAKIAPWIKDRTVLLGVDLNDVDHHRTPLSKVSGEPMLGTLVQAHLTAQILDGRAQHELPVFAQGVLAALLAFAAAFLGFAGEPGGISLPLPSISSLPLWRISLPAVLYLAADIIAFTQFALVLPFGICAIAWGLGLTLGCGYRRGWLHFPNSTWRTM